MEFLVFGLMGVGAETSSVLQSGAKSSTGKAFFGTIKWCFIAGMIGSVAKIWNNNPSPVLLNTSYRQQVLGRND